VLSVSPMQDKQLTVAHVTDSHAQGLHQTHHQHHMSLALQASPLSELYKNNRARVLHEEQAREAEERFRRDHTFKPALYHSHKAPHSGGRLALPHSTDGYKENGGQEVMPAANFTLHKQVWVSICCLVGPGMVWPNQGYPVYRPLPKPGLPQTTCNGQLVQHSSTQKSLYMHC